MSNMADPRISHEQLPLLEDCYDDLIGDTHSAHRAWLKVNIDTHYRYNLKMKDMLQFSIDPATVDNVGKYDNASFPDYMGHHRVSELGCCHTLIVSLLLD